MKNTKKTTKKRFNFHKLIRVTFFVFLAGYLAASIGLKAYNVSLNTQQKQIAAQILTLQSEVDTISIQITDLEEKNRVVSMIDADMDSDNVTNVVDLTK